MCGRKKKEWCVPYVVGTKSSLSGPEMHGNAKTKAENSEWYVGKHDWGT